MGHLPTIIAGSAANPPDLLSILAALAVIALIAWPQIRRERRQHEARRRERARRRQIQADVDAARERTGMRSALGRAAEAARNEGAGR